MPPIFQPEIIADAIHYAAHHRRREIFVGGSTIEAILGQKLVPGFLDRYLAGAAYEGQCADEPADHERPSNLFTPVPGDPGAHGDFDQRARARDPLSTVSVRLGAGGIQAVIATAALALFWLAWRRRGWRS